MNERIEKLQYMQVIGWEFRAVLEQAKIERPLEGLRHCDKLPRPREKGKTQNDAEGHFAQGQEIADCLSRCQDIHVIWICGIK